MSITNADRASRAAGGKLLPLEALRGLAATMVFAGHVRQLTEKRIPYPGFMALLNWGAEAVMLFFVLSGVVIRLSEERRPRTPATFLGDRALRLVPLYALAVLAAGIVAICIGEPAPARVVAGNLLFLQTLQGYVVPTLSTDPPLWSLSLEVGFYLCFALVLRDRRVLRAWVPLAVLCWLTFELTTSTAWWRHVWFVLAFSSLWLAGYGIAAWRTPITFTLASGMSCAALGLLWARVHLIDDYYDPMRLIGFGLLLLPLFGALIGEAPRRIQIALPSRLLLLALVGGVYVATTHSLRTTTLTLGGLAVVATLTPPALLECLHMPGAVVRLGAYLGSISYALYVIHYPVLKALIATSLPAGVSVLIAVALILAASHLLERVAQPALARAVRGRRSRPAPVVGHSAAADRRLEALPDVGHP